MNTLHVFIPLFSLAQWLWAGISLFKYYLHYELEKQAAFTQHVFFTSTTQGSKEGGFSPFFPFYCTISSLCAIVICFSSVLIWLAPFWKLNLEQEPEWFAEVAFPSVLFHVFLLYISHAHVHIDITLQKNPKKQKNNLNVRALCFMYKIFVIFHCCQLCTNVCAHMHWICASEIGWAFPPSILPVLLYTSVTKGVMVHSNCAWKVLCKKPWSSWMIPKGKFHFWNETIKFSTANLGRNLDGEVFGKLPIGQ